MNSAYGIAPTHAMASQVMHKKRRMNINGICFSLFVPWLLFCAVSASRSLSLRNSSPAVSMMVVMFAILIVLASFALCWQAIQRKRRGDPNYEPSWYIFLGLTTLLAFILAMVIGEWNYSNNFANFFAMDHLNDYSMVDPAKMRGKQMMDAGAVNFIQNAFVDTRLAMGFRNDDLYCVAPITSTSTPLASYDFWAVGINCCAGTPGDFLCGDIQKPSAHGGMRLMKDSQRSFFRLAVQQAQAAYQIRAEHPLFFHWLEDPSASLSDYQANGWKYYLLSAFAYFFFQLVLVLLALIFFIKIAAY
eukprot:TRINITY_DN76382_c0_g1_i1.p1 TRINITY_DN76382_c0_g1~~TRINITY_DN76382_c0_g1_i1.p1  ORF type:complete len:303 (+),score=30.69 TRINITY_DN76382_c0_g1_i1:161-1069(+)